MSKKALLVLFLILILGICPATVSGAGYTPIYKSEARSVERQATVSLNKGYTVECTDAVPLDNYADDGKGLTDGIFAPVIDYGKNSGWLGGGQWIGYKAAEGAQSYTVAVTIDLGFVARNIGQIFIRTLTESRLSSVYPEISISASVDGDYFYNCGTLEAQNVENKSMEILINRFQVETTFYARYIRVTFKQSAQYSFLTDEIVVSSFGEVAYVEDNDADKYGRTYDFKDGYAFPKSTLTGETVTVAGADYPADVDFNQPNTSFYIGEGFGEKVKVTNDFMAVSRPYYSHYVNDIRYIVIHNSGICQEYYNAKHTHEYLIYKDDGSSSAWHYTTDDKEIYHGLPDYVVGWHTGTNYNFYGIGIEMCLYGAPIGPGGNNDPIVVGEEFDNWYNTRFVPTMDNTAVLTAELLIKYNLTPDDVKQHTDFAYYGAKQCPYYMRLNANKQLVREGEGWKYFMNLVNKYYNAMAVEGEREQVISYPKATTVPEFVVDRNGTVYPYAESAEKLPVMLPGDADGNGMITQNDAILFKAIVTEKKEYKGYPDINKDGKYTGMDYAKILRTSINNQQ